MERAGECQDNEDVQVNGKESSEEWEKKLRKKARTKRLLSAVEGWFELLDGDGLLDVQSQKIRLVFDGLEVDFCTVTLWTISCPSRSLMTSSMTSWLVVPFHCGILDNDRPEQCCCFVYWLTARVPWLGHATSVSSFLHRTLRKVCTSQNRPRSIAGISLLGWVRFAVTDLVWLTMVLNTKRLQVQQLLPSPPNLSYHQ